MALRGKDVDSSASVDACSKGGMISRFCHKLVKNGYLDDVLVKVPTDAACGSLTEPVSLSGQLITCSTT